MAAAALILVMALGTIEQLPEPLVQVLVLRSAVDAVACRDLDGDGLLDLIAGDPDGLSISFQRKDSRFPDSPDQRLTFKARAVAWDVADLDGRGRDDVIVLAGGRELMVYRAGIAPRRMVREEPPRIEAAGGLLPDDVRHVAFLRDLDGDGDIDVIVPAGSTCRLFLHDQTGALHLGPVIEVDRTIDLNLEGSLAENLSEEIRLPLFQLADVNADGRLDVISETLEKLRTFLAGPDGELPTAPTFELDLTELKKRLRSHDEEPDLTNLAAGISDRVETRMIDCSGEGRADYLVRVGNKISLFLGQPDGVDFTHPRQVLKTSGNIVTFFAVDDDGDARPDLHILRVETISIGDLLLWLVKSGSLRFDLFIYANQGERFSRRPTRHLTLTMKIPALLSFAEKAPDILRDVAAKATTPAIAFDLDGDGSRDDMVLVDHQSIRGFLDIVPSGWTDKLTPADLFRGFMRRIGYTEECDDYTIDLEAFDSWIPFPASELAQQAGAHEPAMEIKLPFPEEKSVPFPLALDLDSDGRDDLLVVLKTGTDSPLRLAIVQMR